MRWINRWWYLGACVGVKGTMFNVIFVAVKQGIVCSTFNRHTCIIDAYDTEWNWQIFGLKLFSTGEIFNKYNIVLFVLILLSFDGLVGTFVNILAMLYILHFCSFNRSVWKGMLKGDWLCTHPETESLLVVLLWLHEVLFEIQLENH